MAENEGKSNVGLTKSFFWIVVVALGVMIVIAVGLWGCQRWKHSEGHDQPQSRVCPGAHPSPTQAKTGPPPRHA